MSTYTKSQLEGLNSAMLMKLWGVNAALSSSTEAQEAFITYAVDGDSTPITNLLTNYSYALNSTIPTDVAGPIGIYIVATKLFDESVFSSESSFDFNNYLITTAYNNYNQKSMHEPASSRNLIPLPQVAYIGKPAIPVSKAFVNFSKHGPKAYSGGNITVVMFLPRASTLL